MRKRRPPVRGQALAGTLVVVCAVLGAASAHAQPALAGHAKAQACAVCHGPLGISVAPDAPNLAGQPEQYLSRQLRAFRSGERRHEVMSVVAKGLSDADIAALAAWFSSIQVDVLPPK